MNTIISEYKKKLPEQTIDFLEKSIDKIVEVKKNDGKVIAVLGSGPNIHEGVTTLVAELINKGIIDGVSTSSAVISHELAGVLDRVKRVNGVKLGIPRNILPKGDIFEITEMSEETEAEIHQELVIDDDLIKRGRSLEGPVIIKAAGNMAYPMGWRTESVSREILAHSQAHGLPFEVVAGWGADPRTMLGAGARKGVPVLVSVPQLIGGGAVGLSIADSISVSERCMRIASMIDSAQVLIESAVALTQEFHDGPFETYTGHGIWAHWNGHKTTRLEGKTLIRIDMDSNLQKAWEVQRDNAMIQEAINKGLPKTKLTGIPFRMEMSGFARLEDSIPVIGDIGVVWPIIAWEVSQRLGIELDFISHPQQTDLGKQMREYITNDIKPFNLQKMYEVSSGKGVA